MFDDDIRQVPSQFTAAFRHFTNLVQGEIKLAKAEMSENVARAGAGIVFFGISAVLALVALNVLAMAAVAAMAASGMSYSVAALIVGIALLVVAVILALVGKSRLSAETLKPKRTIAAVERDIEEIKEAAHVGS